MWTGMFEMVIPQSESWKCGYMMLYVSLSLKSVDFSVPQGSKDRAIDP